MANQLKVAMVHSILTLRQQGWSFRQIAKALGVHRDTVARYVRLAEEGSKPATNPTLGNEACVDGDLAHLAQHDGAGADVGVVHESTSEPANSTLGNIGPPSLCKPFQEAIEQKLDAGLSAVRIWQDLVADHGFTGSYSSVKRFVRRLGAVCPLPFRRMECEPGQEAQVDFGKGALVEVGSGRRRRPHAFRIVLSHSRKAYSESVWRQTTDEFIRVMEIAFWALGGVPKTIVIDNLRAAVSKPDWFDPELNPKVVSFCEHYGTVILPAKPYTPRHKGKVESGIGYVQSNALKARVFKSLVEQNEHLQRWERQVADHRIHGTTRRQVQQLFEQAERDALLPLPQERFPFFHEAQRTVHRDGHVEVDKAYYSAPPEYTSRQVWVRWDTRVLRIFSLRMEQVAIHVKHEPGRFSTDPQHLSSKKISAVERGADYLLKRARLIGPQSEDWARAMLEARGVQGLRVVLGLLSLTKKHSAGQIEQACKEGLAQSAFRLRELRALMQSEHHQEQFDFMQDHPLIRSMDDYGRRIPVRFHDPQTEPQAQNQ
jgi:transposase